MRANAFIAISLFTLLSAATAFAQALPDYPGWRLDQTTPVESVDPNNLEYKDYFTLTPPGTRPPITVDGTTAARLLEGQLNPETIYAERSTGGSDGKKKEDGTGGGAVGWQVAESTYVPVGEEKSRNPAASVTGSSTYAGNGAMAGGNAAGSGGALGSSGGGTSNNLAAAGGGISNFAPPAASGGGGSAGGFNGGSAGKAASNGGKDIAPSNIDTTNMTYSQMIDAANVDATKSACARMGSYAQGGFCSGK